MVYKPVTRKPARKKVYNFKGGLHAVYNYKGTKPRGTSIFHKKPKRR